MHEWFCFSDLRIVWLGQSLGDEHFPSATKKWMSYFFIILMLLLIIAGYESCQMCDYIAVIFLLSGVEILPDTKVKITTAFGQVILLCCHHAKS